MQVRTRQEGRIVTLDLEGAFIHGEDTAYLSGLIRQITQHGPAHVVLNLEGVTRLDCAGIGQLVELRNEVVRSGGCLNVANVERRQGQLLRLCGLVSILGVCDSRRRRAVALKAGSLWRPRAGNLSEDH